MLTLDSNQAIRLSRADDAQFELFINQGTIDSPIRYVFNKNDGCEIYFQIFYFNDKEDQNPQVTYTIRTNGEIVTRIKDGVEVLSTGFDNISTLGDMIIRINGTDISNLPTGEYRYKIRAKVKINGEYIYNTVTPKSVLYIVNDDFAPRYCHMFGQLNNSYLGTYAAFDEQIKNLQDQIDELKEEFLSIR